MHGREREHRLSRGFHLTVLYFAAIVVGIFFTHVLVLLHYYFLIVVDV